MKKALILGGSNGIGLAIGQKLVEKGYYLEICSRTQPDEKYLASDCYLSFFVTFFSENSCSMVNSKLQ